MGVNGQMPEGGRLTGRVIVREFLGVGKWDHVVLVRVKDGCLGLDGCGRAPSLPRGAKQDQRLIARFEVYGDGTTARRADDDVKVMPIIFGSLDW